MKFDKKILSYFDYIQPLLILPIIIFSYILISEANTTLGNKQLVYFGVGFVVFMVFFLFPIRKFLYLIPLFYWVNIALLLSVEFFGISKLGAKRWLELPFVHFTLQPSEIMKPACMLMLMYLIHKNPPPPEGYGVKDFAKFSFYILLPFALIAKEPDLGTALILFLMGFATLFIIGVNKKIWIALVLAFSVSSPVLYNNLHDYQKKRITDFLSEEHNYQVKQAVIAIGNGGIYGKNLEEATQTHFKFLPIATSDFIFAYMVERFGFVGALALIGFYALLIMHLLSLNYDFGSDYLIRVFTSALATLIFIYAGVNISMVIGFAPVVGVPLPFFSYGGSSFITFMILFGILQNLLTFRNKDNYKTISIRL
ncbi:rod shape-determining protein RodA [Campylobacter sp. JMF_01 NE2]|uniref:FtsW/RodA/SpoVE family cell cycle protein n=1 Tax=unclassified Campylobacter TaxID=2593542 RepID=UPI0022E9C795|nr:MULTISPECIES: FtsW/RodA/SpoVE family cell cycle protein [unclassified Campylobacter]MDA3053051.1 rod shape-determining protein RodA [Campylobacter sp. JMF_03 NE3]MDA3067382.1 rod shape-determining protein RodA [Campylobacter sp. JMF_01 NE2]